jgi:hypothetical protein
MHANFVLLGIFAASLLSARLTLAQTAEERSLTRGAMGVDAHRWRNSTESDPQRDQLRKFAEK